MHEWCALQLLSVSVKEAMRAGREKMGCGRTKRASIWEERENMSCVLHWVHLSRRCKTWARWSARNHFCRQLWPCLPSEGLGGGVVSMPHEELQAFGNAPSQLAPLSLHTQRLGMLQTQQWDANPRGGGRMQLSSLLLCYHFWQGARVLECPAPVWPEDWVPVPIQLP